LLGPPIGQIGCQGESPQRLGHFHVQQVRGVQASISTPNTRFSRRAQLMATCRGVTDLSAPSPAAVV
jgi:hypothetical protein